MARAHRALVRTRAWQRFRRAVFERDGWRCVECGKPGALECAHIVPLSRGGAAMDLGNARTLCRSCHIEADRELTRRGGRREPTAAECAWQHLVDEMRGLP